MSGMGVVLWAVDVGVRLIVLALVMLAGDALALALWLGGGSAGAMAMALLAALALGLFLGWMVRRPGMGPSRPPYHYGTTAPRNLASGKTEILG